MKSYSLWDDYNKTCDLLEIWRTGPQSFGTREEEMLAISTPYELNAKLLAFIIGDSISLYLTGIKGICKLWLFVSKMVHEVIFNGMEVGAKLGGFGKIVSGWYLFSTFSKFFSEMSLLRLSRTITLNASTCVFLYPVDFGLNVEVSNLSISSGCLNLILQGKVF